MTTISAGGGRKAVRYLLTASCMRQLRTQDAIAQGRKTKFLIRDSIVLLGAAGEAADYWRLGILLLTQARIWTFRVFKHDNGNEASVVIRKGDDEGQYSEESNGQWRRSRHGEVWHSPYLNHAASTPSP
uniref:Uncharacterized protein n=1 Tax=Leersia perrieri TaxID=77586 RepID=A0A0D9XUQ8_9ORYZ